MIECDLDWFRDEFRNRIGTNHEQSDRANDSLEICGRLSELFRNEK